MLSQLGVKFHGINILTDPDLRQGIKEFSQWPTIPQLYVKGEFVGGCDIIREMFETGELEQLMKEKGVTLATPPKPSLFFSTARALAPLKALPPATRLLTQRRKRHRQIAGREAAVQRLPLAPLPAAPRRHAAAGSAHRSDGRPWRAAPRVR